MFRDKMASKCIQEGCETYAVFGIEGGKAQFCVTHKMAVMVNLKDAKCEYEGCTSIHPVFNIEGGKGRFCFEHKLDGMEDVRNKRCETKGCNIQPAFGIEGGKAKFCATHKIPGMVNVKNKICETDGCNIQPAFGIEGGKAKFCATHKIPGMVNLKDKKCEYEGCKIRPVFGIEGGKAKFCATHKIPGMVNVKNKKCETEGCEIRSNFGKKGNKAKFCASHKIPGMVDVSHKLCEHEGCEIRPNFGKKNGKAKFCATHKIPGMVDVSHKLCEHEECTTRVYYGIPGHKASHCFTHREKGMIRKPNSKCANCKELAIWGTNWTPKHCDTHKTEDDENLLERPCSSCNLLYILDKTNKCEVCNPESFNTARLAKQNALMNYLDARGLTGSSTDKMVDGGICGKERPDRVYDFKDKIVSLECDENKHDDRQCLCEQTRMVNIGQSFGGTPVYFIRWNPDDYLPESDRKNPEILAKRHKLCADLIRDIKDGNVSLPKALVSVIYLYYDGWSSLADEKWQIITPI